MNDKEFVETVTKVLYRQAASRGIKVDEDLLQEAFLRACIARKSYSPDRGTRFSTYLWKAISSVLADYYNHYQPDNLSLDDMMLNDNGRRRDWYLEDTRSESFISKLYRLLSKYIGLVGEDFWQLVTAQVDVSNVLRSVGVSYVKGEGWIECWLGRQLTAEEKQCCQEIKELLRE
jgi:hypothetical protein